jgi:hypothetical protein
MDYNECAISSGAKRGLVRTVIPKLREGIPLPCSIAETRVFID